MNEEIDLHAPFIAEDGLEYAGIAALICDRPVDSWRNRHIQAHRQAGRSEEAIRQWIKGYDGDDPRPSAYFDLEEARARRFRAQDASTGVFF